MFINWQACGVQTVEYSREFQQLAGMPLDAFRRIWTILKKSAVGGGSIKQYHNVFGEAA